MDTPQGQAAGRAGGDGSLELLLSDLAVILSRDRAAYLRLGPEGAVLSVKSPDTFAFGGNVDARWIRMTPDERAQAVVAWIRKAAAYCHSPRVRYAAPEEPVV